jgi:hypothetical protein
MIERCLGEVEKMQEHIMAHLRDGSRLVVPSY